MWHQARLTTSQSIAAFAIAVYAAWNIAWLSRGRLPPSILLYFTGLPCPTTGITRSLIALFHGDFRAFLLFNPFTALYLALTAGCACLLLNDAVHRRRLALPVAIQWSWAVLLVLGWIAKFAIGRQYW